MLSVIPEYEIVLRLILAAVLGGLVGIERERLNWAAGLRTHMLVCLGAALVMLVSQYAFNDVIHQGLIGLDPSRVAAQVVSGIGFLGAGTILFQKNVIRGLTTAASLWAVAAVGLATGGGLYFAAISTTVLIYLILAGIKPLERRFLRKNHGIGLRFTAKHGMLPVVFLQDMLTKLNLIYESVRLQVERSDEKEIFYLLFKSSSMLNLSEIIDELRKVKEIENIELINETVSI